jgi:2-oxoglutarate dehydrogenase complex dehydrogenase (E1) component-like enzyme
MAFNHFAVNRPSRAPSSDRQTISQSVIKRRFVHHLLSQSPSHLQRIGPVVMRAARKIAELLHEQLRGKRRSQKSQPPLRQ